MLSSFTGIDMAGVTRYREGVVAGKYKGLQSLVSSRGITVVTGDGRLTAPGTVTVGEHVLHGGSVVVATGSASRTLPGSRSAAAS